MSTKRKTQKYGWVPDIPDKRDSIYTNKVVEAIPLPPRVNLTAQCPPVYDQGQLGSCTGNAIAGAIEFDLLKQKKADFTPSRLFIYYNERVIEGTINEDSGAMIRDGIKSVASQGDCPEKEWPYNIDRFTQKPPKKCYKDAFKHKAVQYYRIISEQDRKICLASGYPFVIGFTVYESFESDAVAQTGDVPMPTPDEVVIGGHAVLVVGYDDSKQEYLVRNSWGPDWGLNGYFTMPYAYINDTNLSDDHWYITVIT